MDNVVIFTINTIPFVLPGDFITSETSSSTLNYVQSNENYGAIPTSTVESSVDIQIRLTTGDLFFINLYSIFKAAVETAAYLQTFSFYPDYLKFCSYIGKNEYLEYGQLQNYSFSKGSNNDNTFDISLSFQRKNFNKSEGTSVDLKTSSNGNIVTNIIPAK